jgi:hypothetical protein
MNREMKMRNGWIALLALGCWAAASAAESTLPEPLAACASLRRDGERLACFDKAVLELRQGGTGSTTVSAENMFGASRETAGASPESREVKREELRQISGAVTSLRHTNDGMIVLELDNGQVWRQQDSDVRLLVSQGETVTITRASLGTFRLIDKSGRFARFKRIK